MRHLIHEPFEGLDSDTYIPSMNDWEEFHEWVRQVEAQQEAEELAEKFDNANKELQEV